MALTYQPFAETPAVDQLRKDFDMNVSDSERTVSAALGTAAVLAGVSRGGLGGLALLILGGAFLKRAVTGKCEVYQGLGLNSRHPNAEAAG